MNPAPSLQDLIRSRVEEVCKDFIGEINSNEFRALLRAKLAPLIRNLFAIEATTAHVVAQQISEAVTMGFEFNIGVYRRDLFAGVVNMRARCAVCLTVFDAELVRDGVLFHSFECETCEAQVCSDLCAAKHLVRQHTG